MGLPPTEHISLSVDIPCHRHYPGRSDGACSLVPLHRQRPSLCNSQVGSCNYLFRGLLSVHSRYGLHARRVAYATLSIESSDSFVASTAASIATGWSEPVPGRELHPLKSSAFSRRTVSSTISIVSGCHLRRLRRFVTKGKEHRDHPKKDDAALLCAKVRYSPSCEARQPQHNFPAGPPKSEERRKEHRVERRSGRPRFRTSASVFNACWTPPCYFLEKLNRSNKSPIAGVFSGT